MLSNESNMFASPHQDTPKVACVTGGGGIITAGGMAPKGGLVGKTSDGSGAGGAGKPSTSSGGSLERDDNVGIAIISYPPNHI